VWALLLLIVEGGAIVSGRVLDPSGAPVPAARVSLEPAGRVATTDYTGAFRFEGLAAGRYRLTVRATHFKTATRSLEVAAGGSTQVGIMLELAELHQEMHVQDRQGLSVNPAENVDTITLDAGLLKGLPVLDQDVLAAAALFLDPAQTGARGYTLVVDGMETDRLGVTPSAIREVRINQNPYSAEFSSPGRGRLEVLTVKGETAYRGELNLLLRDHRLDARNAFALERPRQQRRTLEGHVTGPLGRSRTLSFLLSGSWEADDQEAVVFAMTPGGLYRQQVPRPQRDKELSLRINYQPDALRWFSWRYETERDSARGEDIGGFDLPEVGTDAREDEQRLYFSLQWVHSPRWLHQLQGRLRSDGERQSSRNPGVPKIVVEDAFTGGGGQVERRRERWGGELSDIWSRSSRRHWLKTGWALAQLDRSEVWDLNNRQGTFYFSSLEDYLAGRPYSFTRQSGEGRVKFWNHAAAAFIQEDFRWRANLSLGLGLRYEHFAYPADANNLAPRVSLAWAPGRKARTVLRAGAGLFYDRLGSGTVRDALLEDGVKLRRVLLLNPSYPDPWAGGAETLYEPVSVVRLAPELRAPYLIQYSFGVSRYLAPETTFSLTYTGLRGVKQWRARDLNPPLPPDYRRPNADLATVRNIESSARLASHSLEAGLRGKFARFITGAILYNWGRSYNDTDGPDRLPPDSLDLSREWARAGFDRRHRWQAPLKLKVGEWFDVGMVLRLESGAPYSLSLGRDVNRDGRADDRPPGVGRHSMQGPGLAVMDVRWSREFEMREKGKLTLGMDAFNALNRVNYGAYVGNLSSPFFGKPVSARPARRMQLGVRFEF